MKVRVYKLMAFLLSGLGMIHAQVVGTPPYMIRIQPVFEGKELVLEKHSYVTFAHDTVQIDRFRFYISSIEFRFSDGNVYAEDNSYHLVDAEKENTLTIVLKGVPKKNIVFIKFNVGVDSVPSVSGALDGDLDPALGMYWAWNTGYINAKLEGTSSSCRTHQHRFEFHIGGYLSPYKALRTVELNFNGSKTDNLVLKADAAAWFKGIELSTMPSVTIPGKQAMKLADNYSSMFSVVKEAGE